MPEAITEKNKQRNRMIRYRGRWSQVSIYLGKLLRMFVYQNDWKVLPMAAVIAGLVAMVIRDMFFLTMEGTLMSAFALACVAIWNGCFNSIQVICRERDVVKREHRSGMHISAYITAHMVYQSLLCLLQTVITMYVFRLVGVKFPAEGLFTRWMIVDVGITVFLVSYASDALSLWISALARNTTTAMTIMPFVLIFQLVFSGGMLGLPDWSEPLQKATVSNYGLTALAAQSDYNNRPMVSLWWSLVEMRDSDLSATVTVGQVMDYLADERNPGVKDLRKTEITQALTVRELWELLKDSAVDGDALAAVGDAAFLNAYGDETVDVSFTLGEAVDRIEEAPVSQSDRDREITVHTSVGQIIDTIGEYETYQFIQEKTAGTGYEPKYENSTKNIAACWSMLILYTLCYAALATITLEFIDKDKR